MLEKNDLKQIENIVNKEIDQLAIKIIKPSFDNVYGRLDKMDGRLDKMDGRLDKMDGRLDKMDGRLDKVEKHLTKVEVLMVTKSYLDDKLADLEGSVIVRQRKEDKKVNLLIRLLKEKKVLTDTEVKMFKEYQIFPSLEDFPPEAPA